MVLRANLPFVAVTVRDIRSADAILANWTVIQKLFEQFLKDKTVRTKCCRSRRHFFVEDNVSGGQWSSRDEIIRIRPNLTHIRKRNCWHPSTSVSFPINLACSPRYPSESLCQVHFLCSTSHRLSWISFRRAKKSIKFTRAFPHS